METDRFNYQQTFWLPLAELREAVQQHEKASHHIGEYYCIKDIWDVEEEELPQNRRGDYAVFTEGSNIFGEEEARECA